MDANNVINYIRARLKDIIMWFCTCSSFAIKCALHFAST